MAHVLVMMRRGQGLKGWKDFGCLMKRDEMDVFCGSFRPLSHYFRPTLHLVDEEETP